MGGKTLGMIAAAGIALGVAGAAQVSIAPDRMAVVDGQRTFVLGLYENPSDDAVLKNVADAGFNLVHASAEAAALDRLQAAGLHAWINVGGSIDLSVDRAEREKKLKELADTFAPHPALLAWEVPDEALWNCWYGPMKWRSTDEPPLQKEAIEALDDKDLAERLRERREEATVLFKRGEFAASERLADDIWKQLGTPSPSPNLVIASAAKAADTMCAGMLEGYKALKGLDPNHPVWMNHAPRNEISQLAAFDKAADVVGCDIYPIPEHLVGHSDLRDLSEVSVGAYTDRMQQAAPGKPVWMVLQGFGWADLDKNPTLVDRDKKRRPTVQETRFMAYDAIAHGARGILYWGTAYIEKDSDLWHDLLKVVRELADRAPTWSAPDAKVQPKVRVAPMGRSGEYGVKALAKNVDGATWILVVNECADPVQYALQGLDGLNQVRFHDPDDAREAVVTKGTLELAISGRGIQLLRPKAGG